jgi:hypothetical protein
MNKQEEAKLIIEKLEKLTGKKVVFTEAGSKEDTRVSDSIKKLMNVKGLLDQADTELQMGLPYHVSTIWKDKFALLNQKVDEAKKLLIDLTNGIHSDLKV